MKAFFFFKLLLAHDFFFFFFYYYLFLYTLFLCFHLHHSLMIFNPSIHTTTGPERDESRDTDAVAWMWFLFSKN